MKFTEDDIYDFFDNEMDKSKFSEFFKSLSEDRNLMFSFLIQKRLKDTFAYRQEILENTDELNRQVMIGLGLNPDPWKIPFSEKLFNFFRNRAVIATLSSIATILILLLFDNNGTKINIEPTQTKNYLAKENKTNSNSNSITVPKKNNFIEEEQKYLHRRIKIPKFNLLSSLKTDSFGTKNFVNDEPITKEYNNNESIIMNDEGNNKYNNSKNETINNFNYIDKLIINNSELPNNSLNKAQNEKIEHQSDLKNTEFWFINLLKNLQFEFKHSQDYYTYTPRVINLNVSPVNKLNISIFYQLNQNLNIGLGFKQETYSISFQENRTDSTIIYYKQPNISTISLDLKYNFWDYKNILRPFSEFSIGGNGLGFLARGKLGIEYFPINNAYFIVGADYSYLMFRELNKIFASNKFSITYGIGFRF